MGQPRYDPTTNSFVRSDDQADIQTIRTRFSAAQINAGTALLPAVPGYAYRFIDYTLIAIGGAAAGATAVVVLGTRTGAVTLLSAAVAALTQSAIVKPNTANVTVLADGASFTPLDANTAITVGKTGGSLTGATSIDVIANYVLEG